MSSGEETPRPTAASAGDGSPFHAGEQVVQERLGVRQTIEPRACKIVRSYLPEEHREFYAALPFVVAAARDRTGLPWATVLAGKPGFARSADPRTLELYAELVSGDALEGALGPGVDLGLLGIDPATGRRNRVNGRIGARYRQGFVLEVGQSFGNCSLHITERTWTVADPPPDDPPRRRLTRLDAELIAQIRAADTLFIATGHRGEGEAPSFGMDASHRGGVPGFIDVVEDHLLLIPDYAGNNYFNTIGNLVLDPRAGLLFIDFETGDLLQLTGRTQIDWGSLEVSRFRGARRLIVFEIDEGNHLEGAFPLRSDSARASSARSNS